MPAVIRAETFFTPPPSMPPDAWAGTPGAELVIRWYEQHIGRRLPAPSEGLPIGPRYARIDAGRWLAECECGSAQVISPVDPRYYCVICYTGWVPLVVPEDIDAVEATVSQLPTGEQWWWHPDDPGAPPPPAPPGPPAGD